MSRSLSVPLRLQQPLHVDTDMNYELDMSKFPGLDDPQQMYQPALLIATSQYNRNLLHPWEQFRERSQRPASSHCLNSTKPPTEPSTKDVLEELLNVIDSCSSELLDRLVDTSITDTVSKSGDTMYKSVMDACAFDKEKYPSPRHFHATSQNTSITNTRVYQPSNDTTATISHYRGLQYNTQMSNTNMDLPKYNLHQSSRHVSHGLLSKHDVLAHSATYKRKRSSDTCDFPILKRQCNRPNTICYYGNGYNNHYSTFQQNIHNRGLVV